MFRPGARGVSRTGGEQVVMHGLRPGASSLQLKSRLTTTPIVVLTLAIYDQIPHRGTLLRKTLLGAARSTAKKLN